MVERSDRLDLIQRAAKRLRDAGADVAPPPQPAPGRALTYDVLEKNLAPNRPEFSGPAHSQDALPHPPFEVGHRGEAAQSIDVPKAVRLKLGELRRMGMITPDNLKSNISFEFRAIKRKLLATARDQRTHALTKNLIMITSALPGEGKTFTATNLALALAAERDLHVLLVDADVIHPSLGSHFEPRHPKGLTNLLNGNCSNMDEVMHVCGDMPNLSIIFSGARDERAPELISSRRMADICLEMSTRYSNRIVIFDTPPVLASSETANLAMHAHQAVMVVSAGQASRSQLQAALELISVCQNVSLVFNKAPKWYKAHGDSYYYYDVDRPADDDVGRT
jgi:protein-tyrosine kinase